MSILRQARERRPLSLPVEIDGQRPDWRIRLPEPGRRRGQTGWMRLRLNSLMERVRASLFFVPVMGVVISIVGAAFTIWIDSRLDLRGSDVPLGVTSTVASARAVLTTVAGATISFAAIAFSISLLIIQQASSQFSPRVVHTLFRDPFNKRVMGLVMGTFTYCLVVLRSVRASAEAGGGMPSSRTSRLPWRSCSASPRSSPSWRS